MITVKEYNQKYIKKFSKKLKQLLKGQDLKAIAKKCSNTEAGLLEIASGGTASFYTARVIAKALGTTLDKMLKE